MAPILETLLLLSSLLTPALSLPAATPDKGPPYGQPLTIQQLQKRQPYDGLPSNQNVTLVYTALGIGHQNYSCDGTAFVQTSPGDGASALLYDTTWFLENNPSAIHNLAQSCNYAHCAYPDILTHLLGDHYFSAALQPTFNLTRAHPPRVLSGVKTGDKPAPNTARNIDWLFLTANPTNGITQGLKEVYRIDTFRGRAPTSCTSAAQTTSVPYTAQYWFFD